MKKIHLLSALLALVLILSGCQLIVYSYSLEQSPENVVSVELRKYDYQTGKTTPYLTLEESAARSLLEGITKLKCYKSYGDLPDPVFSPIVIYISYKDGTAEMLGVHDTCTVDINGRRHTSAFYFKGADFRELLLNYVDASLIPEMDRYTKATAT